MKKLLSLIVFCLSGILIAQNYPLGNLLPYTPPKDSTYFSNEFVHYDLVTGKTENLTLDTSNLIKEIKSEGHVPSSMIADGDLNQERNFGTLAAAYNYSGFPGYPMSAIVRLEMYDINSNLLGYCSGAFIDKNTVLSAAHCVHSPPTLITDIGSVKVVPAYDNGTAPFGTYWATGITVPNNWVVNGDWNYDMLVINLSGNPGLITGYLGWWTSDANTSIFLDPSSVYNTFGYPMTTISGTPVYDYAERMWHMQGYFDFFGTGSPLGTNVVYHYNQGFKGLSGSNTYLYQGGGRYVMAILSHGFDPPSLPNSITGHVRINTFLGNFMYTYAPEIGIEEVESNPLTIFPNPADEQINIHGLNGEIENYTLFDLSGKVIDQNQTTGTIITEGVEPGIYFLRIGKQTTKLVISH